MARSYSSAIFHIVFSTKERADLIRTDVLHELWKYVTGIARKHKMQMIAVGGTENHIHVLIALPARISLSDTVRTLKANSSRWLRESGPAFSWQEGYGAFSVSPSQLERVKRYIANQKEHHTNRSYEDEFIRMLTAANIAFAPNEIFG
jgi:REP element-mobilizing transposase RayT